MYHNFYLSDLTKYVVVVVVVYSRLVQRWVDYMLGALVTTSRDLQLKVIPLLDNLTCQLLALCEYLSQKLLYRYTCSTSIDLRS